MKGAAATVLAGISAGRLIENVQGADKVLAKETKTAANESALGTNVPQTQLDKWQNDINGVEPQVFKTFTSLTNPLSPKKAAEQCARFPALKRFDEAFDKVFAEAQATKVTGSRPAVWYVYNMGIVVKTAQTLFTVDLKHRQALKFAPLVDFAVITHNHTDHYDDEYLQTLDRAHKTVINNFDDNYGAHFFKGGLGGYNRGGKTFNIKDVQISTFVSNHNDYLLDYVMPVVIRVGDFTIFHSGDSSHIKQLAPMCQKPDMWFMHPIVGIKPGEGATAIKPKCQMIVHLHEFGHKVNGPRWKFSDGQKAVRQVRDAGYEAKMPLWGERLI